MSQDELGLAERKYAARFSQEPQSKENGLRYARVLKASVREEQALGVLKQVVGYHPEDRQVLADYSNALAATGNLDQALSVIRKAQRIGQPDWQLLSIEGTILDLLGKHELARNLYHKALILQPDEPATLSNLGMSYVLTNELRRAETIARKANPQPGAYRRIGQCGGCIRLCRQL